MSVSLLASSTQRLRLLLFPRRGLSSVPTRQEIFSRYPVVSSAGALVREARLEHLGHDSSQPPSNKLVPLHPDIWSVRPRIDIIQENVEWQSLYKKVNSCFKAHLELLNAIFFLASPPLSSSRSHTSI